MSIDRFFRKVRTIITADRRQRSLIIKSVLMIGLFRFLLELFPFRTSRRVIARLGRGVAGRNPRPRRETSPPPERGPAGTCSARRPALLQAMGHLIFIPARALHRALGLGVSRGPDGKF